MRCTGWAPAALLAIGVAGGICSPGPAYADSDKPAHSNPAAPTHSGKPTGADHATAPRHDTRRDAQTRTAAATDAGAGTTPTKTHAVPLRAKKTQTPATAESPPDGRPTKAVAASDTRSVVSSSATATSGPSSADPHAATTPSSSTATVPVARQTVEPAASAVSTVSTAASPASTSTSTSAVTPAPTRTLLGVVTGLIFGVFTELERLLTGPPTVPKGSTVTVRSSTLQIASGISVPADWYFPAGDPPQRMILLQHGFFAIGAMYSDTAATLAEQTDSIVVVPTLTSNPFADGGLWVNGVGMQQAVARLFVGDRSALTASALAAGYAQQYHLALADAVLPTQFVLAGHSAGGSLVSGTAGYLVDYGAANDLVGVVLLDAVTTGNGLSNALAKLDAYQQQTGHYVPVQEIGSPPNLWNFISNVNSTLSAARPDQFDGVVLSGGVHTDSMGGGSAISELLVQLLAGFPKAQNPPALRQLAVQWINDWFDGDTDNDNNLPPGSTITITTPEGTATGKVIGTPRPAAVSA